MPENPIAEQMKFIGLLAHELKQAGYFVSQDDDFVWLWKANKGKPDIVAIFLYDLATIKEIRETAENHYEHILAPRKD